MQFSEEGGSVSILLEQGRQSLLVLSDLATAKGCPGPHRIASAIDMIPRQEGVSGGCTNGRGGMGMGGYDIFKSENIFRIKGENDPQKEVISYNNKLMNSLQLKDNIPVFDLIILGLGDDGHTASLFPHEFLKFRDINECLIATHPTSGQKRISLSEKIINNAKEVIFHVTGSGKKYVVEEIINQKGSYKSYPGSYINPKSSNLSWYLDFDAAEMLTK